MEHKTKSIQVLQELQDVFTGAISTLKTIRIENIEHFDFDAEYLMCDATNKLKEYQEKVIELTKREKE